MLELLNVLNIKEFSGKLRSKKSEKLNLSHHYVKLVFENFLGHFVREKFFLRGPRNGRGPYFRIPPPPTRYNFGLPCL
jgi:hypothetical protein